MSAVPATMRRRLELAEFVARARGQHLPMVRGFIPFGHLSDPIRECGHEIVLAGAFTESLNAGFDVFCTFNHNPEKIIGSTSARTLCLSEDERGLNFAATPPDGASYYALARRGRFGGASFSFHPEAWRTVTNRRVTELVKAHLIEVAVVDWPYYPSSRAWLEPAQ